MRKIFVIIWFNILFFQMYSMSNKVDILREMGEALCVDTGNKTYKKMFFDAFPTSFGTFKNVFSWQRDSLTGHSLPPPIENSAKFIDLFFSLSHSIDIDSFCNKTIHICLDGRWEIGFVSGFQFMLLNFALKDYLYKGQIKNHPLWRNLNKYSDEEIRSFWHFYLDYAEWIDRELYIKTKTKLTKITLHKYPRLKRILNQEYKRMLVLQP